VLGLLKTPLNKDTETEDSESLLAESCMGARDGRASLRRAMVDDLMARLVDRWVKGKAQHQTLM
jgi:hypothetical protein